MATATVPRFRKLSRNLQADVCVVGAGITGLTTAYLLGREGKSVVVLDDGEIGSGETGRTTAHLSFVLDDRFHVLERMHGAAGARLAAESHRAAVSRVEQIVRDERIECHFRRLSGYLVLSPDGKPDDLEKEREASRRAGLTDVRLLPRAPNVPWDTGPCLEFPNQAQFHPLRYIAALARAIEHDGGKIFTGSHVEKVEGRPRRPRVTTSEKHAVSAGAVVVATNSPISDYVVTHLKMAAYRTFAIGARIPRNSIIPALLWDTGDPYIYVRIAELDDTDDALIVGGEDHKTGQEDDADKRFRRLEDWARRRYPTIRSVSFRWSGQVMEPADGLAFIGPNPDGAKNVYLATGDSGQGMTHGTLAAMLLTDLILGRENPWESVYDPKRVTLRAVKEMMREGLNVARQYGDWVTPGEVKSVEDIPAGTGRLIRRGKTKIAAYRDERGVVHERSATCTHLGCLVDWNSAENSWDCPCHGSRFDRYGKVLNGPAIRELGEVEDSEA